MPKLRKKVLEIVFSTSLTLLLVPAISSYAANPPAGFTTIILVAKHYDGFCYWI
jgi:hypothetical protein